MRQSVKILISVGAGLALLAGAGAAGAAITAAGPIDGSGVIHGCYTIKAHHGSHVLVLQDVGKTCPRGTKAISWNQRGPAGPKGPKGPPGRNVAAGHSCPSGQFVTGFNSSGNIICSAPAPACPANSMLTATVTSSPTATLEYWPGSQQTLTLSGHPGCTVTVANPSHTPISNIGGTAGTTGWSIVSKTGFTSAAGVANVPTCLGLGAVGSVTAGNYPTCSNASTVLESGHSSATFTVTAS